MATTQINLRVTNELLHLIDDARGDVPRNRWIARLLENALSAHDERGAALLAAYREPPIERTYRQHVPGPNVENVRSSGQVKRDIRPIPKPSSR